MSKLKRNIFEIIRDIEKNTVDYNGVGMVMFQFLNGNFEYVFQNMNLLSPTETQYLLITVYVKFNDFLYEMFWPWMHKLHPAVLDSIQRNEVLWNHPYSKGILAHLTQIQRRVMMNVNWNLVAIDRALDKDLLLVVISLSSIFWDKIKSVTVMKKLCALNNKALCLDWIFKSTHPYEYGPDAVQTFFFIASENVCPHVLRCLFKYFKQGYASPSHFMNTNQAKDSDVVATLQIWATNSNSKDKIDAQVALLRSIRLGHYKTADWLLSNPNLYRCALPEVFKYFPKPYASEMAPYLLSRSKRFKRPVPGSEKFTDPAVSIAIVVDQLGSKEKIKDLVFTILEFIGLLEPEVYKTMLRSKTYLAKYSDAC